MSLMWGQVSPCCRSSAILANSSRKPFPQPELYVIDSCVANINVPDCLSPWATVFLWWETVQDICIGWQCNSYSTEMSETFYFETCSFSVSWVKFGLCFWWHYVILMLKSTFIVKTSQSFCGYLQHKLLTLCISLVFQPMNSHGTFSSILRIMHGK